MKSAKMLAIVVLALGLMVWSAPMAEGAQSLTVNGADVTSITLELGQTCTVEVVSTDGTSYTDYVGFDNGLVLGVFSHLQTTKGAGDGATVTEYNEPAFSGYHVTAAGFKPPPSAGVHFVFEYVAQEVRTTYVKLYNSRFGYIDSVRIKVIPLVPEPMGMAITYQGRLMDAGKPADGLYDFRFILYSKPWGIQEGNTIDINDLDVIDGQFVVELDFGSDPNIFNGYARWLQVGVRPGEFSDPCEYTILEPRVELTPIPYAIYAKTAPPGHSLDAADGSPMNAVYVDDEGNVGIGTTSPAYKLDVQGKVSATEVCIAGDCKSSWPVAGVTAELIAGEPISDKDVVSLTKAIVEPISSVAGYNVYEKVSYASGLCAFAQSFVLPSTQTMSRIRLFVGRSGDEGNLVVRIETDSGSNYPSGTAVVSRIVPRQYVDGDVSVGFNPISFSGGVRYWIVIYNELAGRTGWSLYNDYYIWWGRDASDEYPEGRRMRCNSSGDWSTGGGAETLDLWAKLYHIEVISGTVWKARADVQDSLDRVIGLADENVGLGAPVKINIHKVMERTGWGLSPGSFYYVATTPGTISTSGSKKIGFAISSSQLLINTN